MRYAAKVKLKAQVGMQSLVGCSGKFPRSYGNYFSFASNYARCLNMWAENLEEATKRFLPDGLVEGWLFIEQQKTFEAKWFIVDDPRIPSEWLNSKICWTGASSPNDIEIIREMYSIVGDPNNEVEQFIDPKSYHEKRGGEYIECADGSVIIKTKLRPKEPKLSGEWTIEKSNDIISYHSLNAEEEIARALSLEFVK